MILSMAVVFIILGLTAALVKDYSRTLGHSAPRENLLDAIELGSERIRTELCSATSVLAPSPTGTSTSLRIERLDPGASRLPLPPPDPPPASWDPRDPNHLLVVDYAVSNKVLQRTVFGPSLTSSEDICSGLQGITAQFVDLRSVRVVLTVDVDGYLSRVETEVSLWVEP